MPCSIYNILLATRSIYNVLLATRDVRRERAYTCEDEDVVGADTQDDEYRQAIEVRVELDLKDGMV